MDSLIKSLEKPKNFDCFINEQMKNSTYVAEWKSEMPSPEPCASKVYNAYVAEYAAAMVGSVIDKNGEKPTHQMPTAKQLMGSLSRIADEWQMDNDRLDQYYFLERRYNEKKASFSQDESYTRKTNKINANRLKYNKLETFRYIKPICCLSC